MAKGRKDTEKGLSFYIFKYHQVSNAVMAQIDQLYSTNNDIHWEVLEPLQEALNQLQEAVDKHNLDETNNLVEKVKEWR